MRLAASIGILVVALLHAWFLVLEAFLWTKPLGRRVFGTSAEFAQATQAIMQNQGLYNGFLAAGLVWALATYGLEQGRGFLAFLLACVVVAGIVGALTANPRIFFVQAVPALIAGALLMAT
jgi:putative membrane protein